MSCFLQPQGLRWPLLSASAWQLHLHAFIYLFSLHIFNGECSSLPLSSPSVSANILIKMPLTFNDLDSTKWSEHELSLCVRQSAAPSSFILSSGAEFILPITGTSCWSHSYGQLNALFASRFPFTSIIRCSSKYPFFHQTSKSFKSTMMEKLFFHRIDVEPFNTKYIHPWYSFVWIFFVLFFSCFR